MGHIVGLEIHISTGPWKEMLWLAWKMAYIKKRLLRFDDRGLRVRDA